jgi:hypothetical protein
MPAQIVSDVSTAGVALGTSSGGARLYLQTFAGTLTSGDEVPLSNGNVAVQVTANLQSLATHNGGTLQLAGSPTRSLNFGSAAGSADAKQTDLLAAANSEVDTANEKKMKFNVILADGAKQSGVTFMGGTTPNGEVEGIMNYDFTSNPLTYTFDAATP